MKRKIAILLLSMLCLPAFAFAYVGDAYVTPDSWSRHVNANGIKASTGGIDLGESGTLKAGLTTRAQMRFSGDTDWSIYQYARLRLSDAVLGNGTVNVNLNMRGAYDNMPAIGDAKYHYFYDGLYTSRKYDEFSRIMGNYEGDFRIYQANVEFNKVIPLTDLDLGRIYLSTIDTYKIDGANIRIDPSQYFKLDVYYGLPVSYYTNLKTQVAGASVDIPVEVSGTRIRADYSYFMHEDGGSLNTHVARGRIDQTVSYKDIFSSTLHAEGAIVGKALLYDIGLEANIDKTKTGFSAYVMGQYDKNRDTINPYVSLYESLLSGSSEYIMGGFMITQGITDYLMLGLGYEGRFNFSEAYGDRDYNRVFGNVDLVGLIHRNNYLSLIVDWYDVKAYKRQDKNSKVMGGFRMTQVFTDRIEAWMGVNVQNFQYRNSPVKSYPQIGEELILLTDRNENTTLAYIGGMWKVTDWCVLQLDYTFEYADLFKSAEYQPDVHTVELWVNFVW